MFIKSLLIFHGRKIDELLYNVSDAFEYWRYIYEKQEGSINLNFLRGLRDLLREVCCNKLFQKTWNEYIKDVQR